MPNKEGNKQVAFTLTKMHRTKLKLMGQRSGLSKTQVVQRLIEQAPVINLDGELDSPSEEKNRD